MRLHLPSVSLVVLIAGSTSICLHAQNPANPGPAMSAREVFYEVDQTSTAPTAKPSTAAPVARARLKSQPKTAMRHLPKSAPVAGNTASETESQAPVYADANTSGHVTLASVSDKRYQPLGMRYAVYKLTDNQERTPVDASTVFHSNDHIVFTVEVNTPGYLYVVSRGASGKWSTLFPGTGDSAASSEIKPRQIYTMPPGGEITFAEPAGKEQLFLFLSRQPVRSTEDLMLNMSNGGQPKPTSQPEVSPDTHFRQDATMEAFNRMDDSRIADLDKFYSRDLIVEKVNDDTAAAKPVAQAPEKDNSVYVVDPSGKADSHVVADIVFRHE
jgi:hypothetical protein